jgi:hypothetical protein
LSLSVLLNNLIGWLATIWAIGAVIGGLWFISQMRKPAIKSWIERYTIRIAIPFYFVFALSPVVIGILLMVLLGQTNWGLGLACLSVPSSLVFLLFALKQNNQS